MYYIFRDFVNHSLACIGLHIKRQKLDYLLSLLGDMDS